MALPTRVVKDGNVMRVVMDDGSEYRAIPFHSGVWAVNPIIAVEPVDPPDPDPGDGVFRFPFKRSLIRFSSYYGHSGVDWSGASVGSTSPVRAAGPGVVVGRTTNTVNDPDDFREPVWRGCSITLDHGTIDGIQVSTIYAHMREAPLVNMGDTVSGGQQLGRVGNTGASTGAHLHFEVVYNGVRLSSSTPGNNVPGLGFQRTLAWMDEHANGSW